tara:strand:- start:6153 stop:6971 length:819 start_codon:yes stop_codon:yes gene_type:complete
MSQIIATTSLHQVTLMPTVGAYELNVCVQFNVNERHESLEGVYALRLIQANVTVNKHRLGMAYPIGFDIVEIHNHSSEPQWSFFMPLNSSQIASIEKLRDAGNLDFSVLMQIELLGSERPYHVTEECNKAVAQSDWLEQLRRAKYMDTLLIEVPMPLAEQQPQYIKLKDYLLEAQRHFSLGEYTSSVVSCRKVMEELAALRNKDLADQSMRPDKPNKKMTKDERETAFHKTLHHYMHLAGHSEAENGINFSRTDSDMIIQLTAGIVRNSTLN